MTKQKHRSAPKFVRKKLQYLHGDGIGSLPKGVNQGKYVLNHLDESFCFVFVSIASSRSEFPDILNKIMISEQKWHQLAVFQLQTHGAAEFVSMDEFLEAEGITHRIKIPYDHASNGLIEGANRSIMDIAQTILLYSHLP